MTILKAMPESDYRAHPGINNSFLSSWKENALKALYERKNPPEQTVAMRLGTQFHTLMLEPERFVAEISRLPKLDRRTTAGKETYAKLVAEFGESNLVAEDDYICLITMQQALFAHERAKALLTRADQKELTLTWVDDSTGLECKGRADLIAGGILGDIKTTQDASINFQDSIYKFGYHRQGAYYLRGAKANGLNVTHYAILAVEKDVPNGVNVFSLSDAAIDQGNRELDDLLKQVKENHENGIIPGYSQNVIAADLPEWAWRKIEFGN